MSKKKTPEQKALSNPVGRPTYMTPEALTKFKEALIKGFNDIQCCNYAGITRRTLNYHEEKNPEFREQKEVLRAHPSMLALQNINDSLADGNIETSKWYAERKMKDEFSTKHEVAQVEITQMPTDDLLKLAEQAMAKLKEQVE